MIVIVEDDNSIRDIVCYTLAQTGFDVKGFERGQQFFEYLQTQTPELVLLDIMLSGEDGVSILKKLRANAKTAKMPIIMLTAKDTEYDKVIALDSGADDYITKPFGMMELVSRIKAVLRRINTEETQSEYCFKNLVLDDVSHIVTANGKIIELTLKEYSMLKLLLANQGRVLMRDVLLQKIWGYDFYGETRTIDVHIRTLRTKLLECGDYIETVRGVGYKIGVTK
ncbi:MAG: response regulator transcription factor [Oscillospiraceae bacterium]